MLCKGTNPQDPVNPANLYGTLPVSMGTGFGRVWVWVWKKNPRSPMIFPRPWPWPITATFIEFSASTANLYGERNDGSHCENNKGGAS